MDNVINQNKFEEFKNFINEEIWKFKQPAIEVEKLRVDFHDFSRRIEDELVAIKTHIMDKMNTPAAQCEKVNYENLYLKSQAERIASLERLVDSQSKTIYSAVSNIPSISTLVNAKTTISSTKIPSPPLTNAPLQHVMANKPSTSQPHVTSTENLPSAPIYG